MAKVLLTWEGGAYFGHEFKVTAAAAVLQAAGHDVLIVAPDGVPANGAARRLEARWLNLPASPGAGLPPPQVHWQSRATTLWQFGFQSADVVADRFRAWDAMFAREQPDVVCVEAAPFAQMTAHAVDVPSIEFGVGFDVPPASAPFPPFRNAEVFDPTDALRLEWAMARTIDSALGIGNTARTLHEWVCSPRRLVTSVPELDHYDGCADPTRTCIGPLPLMAFDAPGPAWRRSGPRVLAYLRANLMHMSAFLRAAAALRGDVVIACPDAAPEHEALARQLKLRLQVQPFSMGDLLPEADLVVSHAGGTLGDALAQGCRCVAVPSHYEQYITCMAVHRRRLGTVMDPAAPQNYERSLRHALADPEVGRNAAALALRHRGAAAKAAAALQRAVVEAAG